MMERDGLTEEEAQRRMAAQPTNSEYIQQANVIFSTQWEPEYTQKQVYNSISYNTFCCGVNPFYHCYGESVCG